MILDGHTPESVEAGAQRIRSGGLLGLPTETVYGLGADAENDAAIAQIFAAKGRPSDHPLIVHVLNASGVAHFASNVPDFAQALINAFWPGPLTLILPRRAGIAAAAAGGQNSIGLRSPSHPVAQAVLKACLQTRDGKGQPQAPVWGIAAPSANQFGRVSPTTAAHVQGEFGADLLILDGGPCDVGIESTIIDCTRGVPVLLRPGAISREQVQAACGLQVLLKDELIKHESIAPRASGTLESHYAPKAKVRLMHAPAMQAALDRLAAAASVGADGSHQHPAVAIYSRTRMATPPEQVVAEQMPPDAASTAHQLFAVLRALDAQGVNEIWIDTPPEDAEWDGVRDRLQRAAAS
jgi:L-threonylcarbamoyladenylate synthase